MSRLYCDYNHKKMRNYWLVMPDEAPVLGGVSLDEWELVRKRSADRLSDGGRRQVDEDGYAILQFHIELEELQAVS